MKKWLFPVVVLFLIAINFVSCSSSLSNSITFNNSTQGDIYINFRGQVITIPSGQNSVVNKIPQGTYNYATTFSVPAGATASSSQGNLAGSFTISADTKIMLLYTSTFLNGSYTVYVTISNSDTQSTGTPTSP